MKIFLRMFSRKWVLTTLLVIAACGVMVRLGIWQLDRLEKRRAFNERVYAQEELPMLLLDSEALDEDLFDMEYREALVLGEFISEDEVVLRNQVYNGLPGYRLFTPLHITGTNSYVMVDRGFVPSDQYATDWERYPVTGQVEVFGVIRRGQSEPDFGGRPDPTPLPGERLSIWNIANVDQMETQLAYDLLSIYIQMKPLESEALVEAEYPAPYVNELELTEGPHLGYAFQWFLFASILGLGYPFFIKRESQVEESKKE